MNRNTSNKAHEDLGVALKPTTKMPGFHMSAEEIRQSEDKLKQEKSWDNQGLHAEIRVSMPIMPETAGQHTFRLLMHRHR